MNSLMLEAPPELQRTFAKATVRTTVAKTEPRHTAHSHLSAYSALMELFDIGRLSSIAIRTHDGEHLASPLVMTRENLAIVSTNPPKTEDEHLIVYVAQMLDSAVATFKLSKPYRVNSFFTDVSRVLTERLIELHESRDFVVREISITWLDYRP